MSESNYAKCSCTNCGKHIEFPEEAAGTKVDCPHCGWPTELLLAGMAPTPEPPPIEKVVVVPGNNRNILIVGGIVVLVLVGGAFFVLRGKHPADSPPPKPAPIVVKPAVPTNPPPPPTNVVEAPKPAKPTRPKSPDDLKVGEITIEKAKGSSLVYAVGSVKNDSDYQRFGVRVELDLLNRKGEKVGTAKDYLSILEPRKDWQFRAMVLDSKPVVSATLSGIKEDE